MDDLISRQAAIDAMSAINDSICEQQAIDALWELPSAQPDWIPCSEITGDGYPEEEGIYYVTEQNYGFYLDAVCKQRVTHTSHFINGTFIDRFYSENNSNIIAWMPLPKPYEGRQDDN